MGGERLRGALRRLPAHRRWLADRVGAGRLFVAATVAFGVAGVAGGVAGSGEVLLGARFAQGFAAALLQPAILGLLGTAFPARSRALSVWGAVGASGLAAGVVRAASSPASRGVGRSSSTCRWTLLCPIGHLIWLSRARRFPVPLAGRCLAPAPRSRGARAHPRRHRRLHRPGDRRDARGLPLLTAGFLAPKAGRRPALEPSLRHIRSLRVGVAATALYMASVGSEFYVVTLLLQT